MCVWINAVYKIDNIVQKQHHVDWGLRFIHILFKCLQKTSSTQFLSSYIIIYFLHFPSSTTIVNTTKPMASDPEQPSFAKVFRYPFFVFSSLGIHHLPWIWIVCIYIYIYIYVYIYVYVYVFIYIVVCECSLGLVSEKKIFWWGRKLLKFWKAVGCETIPVSVGVNKIFVLGQLKMSSKKFEFKENNFNCFIWGFDMFWILPLISISSYVIRFVWSLNASSVFWSSFTTVFRCSLFGWIFCWESVDRNNKIEFTTFPFFCLCLIAYQICFFQWKLRIMCILLSITCFFKGIVLQCRKLTRNKSRLNGCNQCYSVCCFNGN